MRCHMSKKLLNRYAAVSNLLLRETKTISSENEIDSKTWVKLIINICDKYSNIGQRRLNTVTAA